MSLYELLDSGVNLNEVRDTVRLCADALVDQVDAQRTELMEANNELAELTTERNMQANLVLVRECLDPRKPVRVGPHWVVDPCEIDIEFAATFPKEVRKKETHLVV